MNKRFVIYTNVIISAVLQPRSNPYYAIKKAQRLGFILVFPVTLVELETVIYRSKFDRYNFEYSNSYIYEVHRAD